MDIRYIVVNDLQCCLAARDIGNVLVRYVKRSVSHVAHVLARATDSSSVFGEWISSRPPLCIADLV